MTGLETLLPVLVVGVALVADGEAASGDPTRVKTSFFGEIETDGVALAVMDGGTHGVQGHVLVVGPDGAATWERYLDGLRPHGRAGRGEIRLTDDERWQVEAWSRAAWEAAGPGGRTSFMADVTQGPPRWVWAVVVRRGDETRLVEGSARGWLGPPVPPPLRPLLEWLMHRVDQLSQEAP